MDLAAQMSNKTYLLSACRRGIVDPVSRSMLRRDVKKDLALIWDVLNFHPLNLSPEKVECLHACWRI